MKTLLTGATGFVARHLLPRLDGPIHVLARDADRARAKLSRHDVRVFPWAMDDGSPPPADAFEGVEAVFHLAGEPVMGIWTEAKKRAIRDSRVRSAAALAAAMSGLADKPAVFLSASATGYYGNRGDDVLTEDMPPGHDFLATTCVEWEAAARTATDAGIRTVLVRTPVVFGPDGGALPTMLKVFRLGMGGKLGSGRQYFPWVHVEDLAAIYLHLARTDGLAGAFNATATEVPRNEEFTRTLGELLGRPTMLPVPEMLLKLLGEQAQLLLASQNVLNRKLRDTGFVFAHPTLESGLADCLTERQVPASS